MYLMIRNIESILNTNSIFLTLLRSSSFVSIVFLYVSKLRWPKNNREKQKKNEKILLQTTEKNEIFLKAKQKN